MKRITIILLCLIFLIQLVKSQNEINISGFVKDFKSGEVLIKRVLTQIITVILL